MRVTGGVNTTGLAEKAVIEKRGVHKWVNDKVVGSTDATVLTDATLYYNLVAGEIVLIYAFEYGVTTNADICHFEVGYTTEAAGAGTFTALMGHYEFSTPAAKTLSTGTQIIYPVPMRGSYAKGARSISIRCTAGDNDVAVSLAYCAIRVFVP